MSDALREFMSRYQSHIEQHLASFTGTLNNFDTRLIESIRYSLLGGGKRVRPLLAYAAATALGRVNTSTDAFATALECIHVYSLVHDDLPAMDDDKLRRGKATNHIAYDEATAILAGDGLQSLAFQAISEAPEASDAQKVAAISCLSRAAGIHGMVMGQAIDLHFVDDTPSLEELETMHRHKTGALIEASVVLGAISAGASQSAIDTLRAYAQAIGLAFQVQDDILDVTADTQTLGKTQGADIKRNKPTYVSLLGLEGAQVKAQELRTKAISQVEKLGENANILVELADYIVNRQH